MVADDFRAKLYYGGTDADFQQTMAIVARPARSSATCDESVKRTVIASSPSQREVQAVDGSACPS